MNEKSKVEQAIEYLNYVLRPLCDYPEDVKIVYTIDERGLLLDLTANDRDLSRLIGSHGINIWSLRNIMRLWGEMNEGSVVKLLCRGRGMEFYQRRYSREKNKNEITV